MNAMSSIQADPNLPMRSSPFDDLAYRALTFVKCDQHNTPLYFVAGLQGGPWGAENALARSHKVHGGPCFYCEVFITKGDATIDHVEPVSRGGNSAIQNLVIACKPCNSRKGPEVLDFHNPKASQKWLESLRLQVDLRLAALAIDHPA